MVRRILITVSDEQFEFIREKKNDMGCPSWDKFMIALCQDYPDEFKPSEIEEVKEEITTTPQIQEPQVKEATIWDD